MGIGLSSESVPVTGCSSHSRGISDGPGAIRGLSVEAVGGPRAAAFVRGVFQPERSGCMKEPSALASQIVRLLLTLLKTSNRKRVPAQEAEPCTPRAKRPTVT